MPQPFINVPPAARSVACARRLLQRLTAASVPRWSCTARASTANHLPDADSVHGKAAPYPREHVAEDRLSRCPFPLPSRVARAPRAALSRRVRRSGAGRAPAVQRAVRPAGGGASVRRRSHTCRAIGRDGWGAWRRRTSLAAGAWVVLAGASLSSRILVVFLRELSGFFAKHKDFGKKGEHAFPRCEHASNYCIYCNNDFRIIAKPPY